MIMYIVDSGSSRNRKWVDKGIFIISKSFNIPWLTQFVGLYFFILTLIKN